MVSETLNLNSLNSHENIVFGGAAEHDLIHRTGYGLLDELRQSDNHIKE